MNLATHQRQLLQLLKRGGAAGMESDDSYIQAIARSRDLEVLREVVLWWREFDVERTCVLTSSLLKRRGLFPQSVRDFSARGWISPFVSELGLGFLRHSAEHPDPIVAALAKFELAVIAAKRGEPGEYSVDWPCDPRPILDELKTELTADDTPCRTIVSASIPGMVRAEAIA